MDQRIKSFLDYDLGVPDSQVFHNAIVTIIVSSIPTAVFGKYALATSILILPMALLFIIWALILRKKHSKRQFFLFMGVLTVYLSFIFLIAGYKVMDVATPVTLSMILKDVLIYFLVVAFTFLLYAILIKKDIYSKYKSAGSGIVLAGPAAGIEYVWNDILAVVMK